MGRDHLTIEHLVDLNIVSDAQIAPGGDRIAYSIAENGKPKGAHTAESRIWTLDLSKTQATQASFGPGADHSPRWSPDGHRLAFLSDRDKRGTAQIYLLDDSPREARKLTDIPSGVVSYQWSADGDALAFISIDHVADDSDNDVTLFDAEPRFRRLYRYDVETGETTQIAHGDLHIWEFCWSPDGTQLAVIASEAPYEWSWYSAQLILIDAFNGKRRVLHTPERQIARPVWSPDGATIAVITCRWSDPGMTGGDVLLIDAASGECRNITSGQPRSHLAVHWLPNSDGLVSIGWERARAQVSRITLPGDVHPLWTDDMGIDDSSGTFDPVSGLVAAVMSRNDAPPEVWMSQQSHEDESFMMAPVTKSNVDLPFPSFESEWLSWQSTDGLAIEGLYLVPDRRASDEPPAMVTLVHGGPTVVTTSRFPNRGVASWIPFLLQSGFAIFMPNYRGSNGYGVEFAEANVGDLGGLDWQDVLSGVDECVRLGLADSSRLGLGGWSYGGYMTAWGITQTDRFQAAVAGASITNWFSFHGGSNIPGFDEQFVTGSPDETGGQYERTSPLFATGAVTTPTLFLHGEQDPICPVGQAYEMTRAMKRRGIDVECAVYPREGHGFTEREHLRDMIERAVSWFNRYLGGS